MTWLNYSIALNQILSAIKASNTELQWFISTVICGFFLHIEWHYYGSKCVCVCLYWQETTGYGFFRVRCVLRTRRHRESNKNGEILNIKLPSRSAKAQMMFSSRLGGSLVYISIYFHRYLVFLVLFFLILSMCSDGYFAWHYELHLCVLWVDFFSKYIWFCSYVASSHPPLIDCFSN